MSKTFCVAIAALLILAMHVSAHHAFTAEYDESRRVTVSGTVSRFDWTNPHGWLYVNGTDENGKLGLWAFEMGSPGGLTRRGWSRTALNGGKLFGGFQTTPGAPGQVNGK
jgi:hypothetical protein